MPAGYSGTPLAKKLGVKEGQRTWRLGMPPGVAAEIAAEGAKPMTLMSFGLYNQPDGAWFPSITF